MTVLLPDFTQAHLLVVGDVMLDRYWLGKTSRISPEAPVPIVNVEREEHRAGGAANVALNSAVLGVKTTLVGFTGEDYLHGLLVDTLSHVGVDCCFCQDKQRPTITKLRVLSQNQQLLRADFEDNFAQGDHAKLLACVTEKLAHTPVVVLSDYQKGTLKNIHALIASARSFGCQILVDPKGQDFSQYCGATLLTPNFQEFCAVVGVVNSEEELKQKGFALIQELALDALLITRSEHGMTLLHNQDQVLHLPTQAKEVFDVTGAGDTVIATLSASLAAGETLAQACVLANRAAGIVVGKLGTATVSPAELEEQYIQACDTGVVNEEQLQFILKNCRRKNEKIVMTNGCFDILHAGHIAYLKAAKALGDRLIVAVNTDESVRKLKGRGRPINDVVRRMEVLAALGAVDWVVPFSEETPARLVDALAPDCLVKGGDYRPDEIAGAQSVRARGGEVRVLLFKEGYSTTQIIEKIYQQKEN